MLDFGDLRLNVLVYRGVERLVGQAVVVKPHRVRPGGRGQRPVDRGLAPALGVALQVVLEETGRTAKIVAQVGDPENPARLLLDVVSFVPPEQVEHLANSAHDVVPVRLAPVAAGVVDDNAVPRDAKGIRRIGYQRVLYGSVNGKRVRIRSGVKPLLRDDATGLGGKRIRSDQDARRAVRQGLKRIRQAGRQAGIQAHTSVPPPKRDAQAI